MSARLPRVLLIEPQFVLRRTIVMVARDLGIVEFDEASSVGRARAMMASQTYAALVLDLEEKLQAMDLLSDLRLGKFACPSDARAVVLAANLQPEDTFRLQKLGVARVFSKPVRISELLNAMEAST